MHEPIPKEHDEREMIGLGVGLLGAMVLAFAMAPLRDHVHNANMALLLVLPVLLAAVVGGRRAGVLTAIVAALSFNFVFTQPYLSLHIENGDDIATFITLTIVALAVAEIGVRARDRERDVKTARSEISRLVRIVEQAAHGAAVEDVIASVRAEVIGLFDLTDCTYETGPSDGSMPRLGPGGVLENASLTVVGEVRLPAAGVEIPVAGRGQEFGRLVLYPHARSSAPIEKRLVAVGLADALGLTLATFSPV
jgi:hypothetical protein